MPALALQKNVVAAIPVTNESGTVTDLDLTLEAIFVSTDGRSETLPVVARVQPGDNAATMRSKLAAAVRSVATANNYAVAANQCYLFDFVKA